MKLQLTISLLVSDKIHTLRRCLDSLVPLLTRIPSELIAVYTGEKARALEIVKEYTDNIIPFTWCNDFSAARNAGLRAAKGEWFCYLDDDEWFEDVSEIISFFEDGEYKGYKSASYLVRNYSDYSGQEYMAAKVGRMTVLTPQSRFQGTIHELLSPFVKPEKVFSAFVHHYGYVKRENRDQSSKAVRNLPLLQRELKENPQDIHIYAQLVQEYVGLGDYKKAEQCSIDALSLPDSIKASTGTYLLLAFLPAIIAKQGEMKRAIEAAQDILKDKFCKELTKVQIYAVLVELCAETKRDAEAIAYAEGFHELIKYLEEQEKVSWEQECGKLSLRNVQKQEPGVYQKALECGVRSGSFDKVQKILSWLPWLSFGETESSWRELDNLKSCYFDKEQQILECYAGLTEKNAYISLQKALLSEGKGDREEAKRLWEECIAEDSIYLRAQLAEMGLRNQWGISVLFRYMDLEHWKECIGHIIQRSAWDDWAVYLEGMEDYKTEFPVYMLVLEKEIRRVRLLNGIVHQEDQEFLEELKNYSDCTTSFYHVLYKLDVFRAENRNYLPEEYHCADYLQLILRERDSGNFGKGIGLLKKAVCAFPPMVSVFRRLLKVLQRDMECIDNTDTEFYELGVQVKQTLEEFVQNGQYVQALPILEQLTRMLPNDLEVLKMRQTILKKLPDTSNAVDKKKMTLNLVMIVKDEEDCLKECLERARALVDKMIIVDTGSVDRTKEIAQAFGADVYEFKWCNDFASARNFALNRSDSDWNLVLDADECLAECKRSDIAEFMENMGHLGLIACESAYQDHGETSHSVTYIPRLLPGHVRYKGKIHEQPNSPLPQELVPLLVEHSGYLDEEQKTQRNLPYLLEMLKHNPDNAYIQYKAACSLHHVGRSEEALSWFKRFYGSAPDAEYRTDGVIHYLYTLIDLKQYEHALRLVEQEEERLYDCAAFQFACALFFMKLVLFDTEKYIDYLPRIEECYLTCLHIGEKPGVDGVLGLGSYKAAYNLGTWYEVSGNPDKARLAYEMADKWGYEPAKERLKNLQ